jgi:Tfp pilus assembly protein PilF
MTNPSRLGICLVFCLCTLPASAVTSNKPRIAITSSKPTTHPELEIAYQHLRSGALTHAEQAYLKIIDQEPHNTDALLALAAIAKQQGNAVAASHYQEQAMSAEPLNTDVQAASLNHPGHNPKQAESRLKTLISQYPLTASLHFALGNLHARKNRWPEAKAAYSKAVAADTNNPDYLFNLAVSLDHLNQPQLAAQQYQQALLASKARAASFDIERVHKRLQELPR